MKIRALAFIAAIAIPSLALADTPTVKADKTADKATKLSDADLQVVAHLHHVNQMEIDIGKLAQKSGTAPVKKYGEMLVKDHTTADKDALALVKKHGTAMIPAEKPATDAAKAEDKDMMDQVAHLKTLKAAEFDRDFLTMMVTGHEKELAKIDVAMGTVENADLKEMLTNTKPVLQRHADQARDVQKNAPSASAADKPVAPATKH